MTDCRGKRFAIIGGGLSGMATALLLARHGCDVAIVEKNKTLGATLRGFSRRGVHFETGLHYMGGLSSNGPLLRYFRLLGLDGLSFTDFNQECFDRLRFPDSGMEIRLPVGQEPMAETLCSAFPAESRFIRAYLQTLRSAFLSSTFLNFDGDFRKHADEALHAQSLDTVLRQGTSNATLRTVLSMHSLLYGVAPTEAPFLQHARVAGSYLDGVKTVQGGGKALVAALEARLAEAGVTVLCGSGAKTLQFSPHKTITGVFLEDERFIPADGVVYTAHPGLLPDMIPAGAVKPAFCSRLRSLEDTMATVSLFCVSDSPLPLLRGSNCFICPEGDIEASFRPDCLPGSGPAYITGSALRSAASPGSPGSGEDSGGNGFIIFAPGGRDSFDAWADSSTGKRPEAYTRYKAERLARLWETVAASCPELEGATIAAGATPLTNRDFLASPGCGLYGTKHSLGQFSPLPMTRTPNLWMAGQSVIAPGILGAIVAAVVACGCILGMDTMHKKVAACV